mmetsp:Transcript_11915/g.22064  ORF Transcript_11915/g.22064 Transcript_11915/m.22064 type:complete len:517 (+) Transcript_11915:234-1784(+)
MTAPNEVFPLVPGRANGPYGVYNDNYTPVDEDSRNILQRRRWVKYGGIALVVVAAAAAVAVTHNARAASSTGMPPMNDAVQSEHLFAGLLADDTAFYFPMAAHEDENNGRRSLLRSLAAAPPGVDWSFNWAENAKDGAAVGEYYKAKGLAMADYYRSKFDPTYKATAGDDPADSADQEVDAAPWTYDWKADKDRGMAIGQKYKDIGLAISDHYRQAFDPTYPGPEGRMLKSKAKKKRDKKREELAEAMAAEQDDAFSGTGWYDWAADRDRGMAIGQHYKELGQQIADHYNQEFNPMYDVNKKTYTEKNWPTMWMEYKARGQEIGDYYKSKGLAIAQYYASGKSDENANRKLEASDEANANDAAVNDATAGSTNPAYVWGLDSTKDREKAMQIHEDLMKKGIAIGNYYRAKYDPTYGSGAAPADAAPAVLGSSMEEAGEASSAEQPAAAHNPDLDFPPWGQDPVADRAHGIALGQYWKQQGKQIGAEYKQHGKELGLYYEDFYRSKFDPTYKAGGAN